MWCSISIVFCFLGIIHTQDDFEPPNHDNWKNLEHGMCGDGTFWQWIIAGREVTLGSFPWIAGIVHVQPDGTEITYACSGSIINRHTILTAAHCVSYLAPDVKVGKIDVGSLNQRTEPDCQRAYYCNPPVQTFGPREIVIHARYPELKDSSKDFDIALIRLTGPIDYNNLVRPICVLSEYKKDDDYHYDEVITAGWASKTEQTKTFLRKVELKLEPIEDCPTFENFTITMNQMCVGSQGDRGQGDCFGGGGGPIMLVKNEFGTPRTYIIGIVTYRQHSCEYGSPTVATRIEPFIKWILDNLVEGTTDFLVVGN